MNERLEEAAAARDAGGWLRANIQGGRVLYRFAVAGKGRERSERPTAAPVRPPAEPRIPGLPGSRPANPWPSLSPLCRVQQPAHPPAADLKAITEAMSKEFTATVKGLLEHHQAQAMAFLQAAP